MQQETWQVQVEGNIYETDFAGLTQWIAESSLLPEDMVRRKDLRWIEARLVPALNPYFGGAPPLVVDTAATNGQNLNPVAPQNHLSNTAVNYSSPENFDAAIPNLTANNYVAPPIAPSIFDPEPDDLLEIFSEPTSAPLVNSPVLEIDRASESAPLFVPELPAVAAFESFAKPEPYLEPLPDREPELKVEIDSVQEAPAPLTVMTVAAVTTDLSMKNCALHPEIEAAFACRQCLSLFCEECPRSIAKVRICPRCGDMCQPYGAGKTFQTTLSGKSAKKQTIVDPNFGFNDFLEAWRYPLKFPLALLLGGVVTSVLGFGFYMGITAAMFGDTFSGGMAILFCGVLSVAFTFGCASNAVKQVAYGKTTDSFFSNGEDFSFWESILRPCLLGVSTYAIAWGPAVILLVMFIRTLPSMPDELAEQLKKAKTAPPPQAVQTAPPNGTMSPAEWQAMLENDTKQGQVESAKKIEDLIKKTQDSGAVNPAAQAPLLSKEQMIKSYTDRLMGRIVPFIIAMGLALLWGLAYFPMALIVAGYTQSIGATLNPLVGLDTIKQMGANYFRAFGSYLLLLVGGLFIMFVLGIIMIPLSMTGIGMIAAPFLTNTAAFYLYIVTANIFGTALYRSHEKLGYTVP